MKGLEEIERLEKLFDEDPTVENLIALFAEQKRLESLITPEMDSFQAAFFKCDNSNVAITYYPNSGRPTPPREFTQEKLLEIAKDALTNPEAREFIRGSTFSQYATANALLIEKLFKNIGGKNAIQIRQSSVII